VRREEGWSVSQPRYRVVHFWTEDVAEPPCGTLEDRFDWTDAVEDVTCDACREALAGDGGDLSPRGPTSGAPDEHPAA
jgi:hypothetical protein